MTNTEQRPGPGILRLCLVADIHHGPDRFTKKGTTALELLDRFLAHAGEARPDLILDLGDRITDQDRGKDLRGLGEIARAFGSCGTERVHLLGNHDLANLSREENSELLGQDLTRSLTIRKAGWRLIFWQAGTAREEILGRGDPGPDLDWLEQALSGSEEPTAVFSHLPLAAHSQTGNYYFENNPEFAVCPAHTRVREILDATGCPLVWIAGHVHWNTFTLLDGLPHLTVQSLTESFTTPPRPCRAFSDLTLGPGGVVLKVHGLDPLGLTLPLPARGPSRWTPPLGPFFGPTRTEAAPPGEETGPC